MTPVNQGATVAPPQPSAAMTSPRAINRTPGRAGDFDFLNGRWSIMNTRPAKVGGWEQFPGQATCYGILNGVCSVEELRIPERQFSGMGLRLLDVKEKVWIDHWVNAAHGVITLPGMSGSFEQGAGIFEGQDEDQGKVTIFRGVWDQIGETGCRWQQGSSTDGGRTWSLSWSMIWTRMS